MSETTDRLGQPVESSADRVFAFIASYLTEHGYPPTVRDICEGVGLSSSSTVHAHLLRLRRQGRVEWADGKVRTLRLITS